MWTPHFSETHRSCRLFLGPSTHKPSNQREKPNPEDRLPSNPQPTNPVFPYSYPSARQLSMPPSQHDNFLCPTPPHSKSPSNPTTPHSTKGNISLCPLLSVCMPSPAVDKGGPRFQKTPKAWVWGVVIPADGYRVSFGSDAESLNKMERVMPHCQCT